MTNIIVEITTTGGAIYDEIPNVPDRTASIKMMGRGVAFNYRFRGQTTEWNQPADLPVILKGRFNQGDLFVNAAGGSVVQVEMTTVGDFS